MKMFLFLITTVFLGFHSCTNDHLEWVKSHASQEWEKQGFTVVAYEGHGYGLTWFDYGGAKVWYRLSKPSNDITYSGYLQRWGKEIHVYGPEAIDAIRPLR